MPITEDTANQPAALQWAGAWTSAQVSAPFSPQAGTLLLALLAADGTNAGTVTGAITDSAGAGGGPDTWHLLHRQNTNSGSTGGTAEVWCRYLSTAPGSMTVSVTGSGATAGGGQLVVRSLLGANPSQAGAHTGTTGAGILMQTTLTPATAGNAVYGASVNWTNATTSTANAQTTGISSFLDGTNVDTWNAFKGTAATTTSATSYGYSSPSGIAVQVAAVEIQTAAAGTDPQWLRFMAGPGRYVNDPLRWEPWLGTGTDSTGPAVVDAAADLAGSGSLGAAAVLQPEAAAALAGAGSLAAAGTIPGTGITFRAAAGGATAATTNLSSVVIPAPVQAGDLMLVKVSRSGNSQTVTPPAGWNLEAGPVDKGTILREYVYSRAAQAGDAGTTVSWDWGTSDTVRKNIELVAYSGAAAALPTAPVSFVETAAGTSHTAPSITVGTPGSWLLEWCSDRGSPGSTDLVAPAGFVERDQQITTGGGGITTSVTDSGTDVPTGTAGGDTWTGTLSTANSILWSILIAPGTVTVSAAAGLAGSGSLAAAGVVTQPAAAALTGSGSLAATAVVTQPATATLTGSGTLAATAVLTRPGAASLAAAGALTAAGVVAQPATAALAGAGTLTAAGTVTGASGAAADLVGGGSLAAAALRTAPAAATLAGAGTLTAAAVPDRPAAAALSAAGALTAAAVPSRVAAVSLTAAGALTAAPVMTAVAVAALNGLGILIASTAGTTPAAAALAGTGTVTAGPAVTRPAGTSLAAAGTLSAAAVRVAPATAALGGVGSLAAAATRVSEATVALVAAGSLAGGPLVGRVGAASLVGRGTLAAAGVLFTAAAVDLVGVGSIGAVATLLPGQDLVVIRPDGGIVGRPSGSTVIRPDADLVTRSRARVIRPDLGPVPRP